MARMRVEKQKVCFAWQRQCLESIHYFCVTHNPPHSTISLKRLRKVDGSLTKITNWRVNGTITCGESNKEGVPVVGTEQGAVLTAPRKTIQISTLKIHSLLLFKDVCVCLTVDNTIKAVDLNTNRLLAVFSPQIFAYEQPLRLNSIGRQLLQTTVYGLLILWPQCQQLKLNPQDQGKDTLKIVQCDAKHRPPYFSRSCQSIAVPHPGFQLRCIQIWKQLAALLYSDGYFALISFDKSDIQFGYLRGKQNYKRHFILILYYNIQNIKPLFFTHQNQIITIASIDQHSNLWLIRIILSADGVVEEKRVKIKYLKNIISFLCCRDNTIFMICTQNQEIFVLVQWEKIDSYSNQFQDVQEQKYFLNQCKQQTQIFKIHRSKSPF